MDIKPYVVRYKSGADKSIKPGIHGRFISKEKAEEAMDRAARYFGGQWKKKDGFLVGRAIIGIVIDQEALKRQEEEANLYDPLKSAPELGDELCVDESFTGEPARKPTTSTAKK